MDAESELPATPSHSTAEESNHSTNSNGQTSPRDTESARTVNPTLSSRPNASNAMGSDQRGDLYKISQPEIGTNQPEFGTDRTQFGYKAKSVPPTNAFKSSRRSIGQYQYKADPLRGKRPRSQYNPIYAPPTGSQGYQGGRTNSPTGSQAYRGDHDNSPAYSHGYQGGHNNPPTGSQGYRGGRSRTPHHSHSSPTTHQQFITQHHPQYTQHPPNPANSQKQFGTNKAPNTTHYPSHEDQRPTNPNYQQHYQSSMQPSNRYLPKKQMYTVIENGLPSNDQAHPEELHLWSSVVFVEEVEHIRTEAAHLIMEMMNCNTEDPPIPILENWVAATRSNKHFIEFSRTEYAIQVTLRMVEVTFPELTYYFTGKDHYGKKISKISQYNPTSPTRHCSLCWMSDHDYENCRKRGDIERIERSRNTYTHHLNHALKQKFCFWCLDTTHRWESCDQWRDGLRQFEHNDDLGTIPDPKPFPKKSISTRSKNRKNWRRRNQQNDHSAMSMDAQGSETTDNRINSSLITDTTNAPSRIPTTSTTSTKVIYDETKEIELIETTYVLPEDFKFLGTAWDDLVFFVVNPYGPEHIKTYTKLVLSHFSTRPKKQFMELCAILPPEQLSIFHQAMHTTADAFTPQDRAYLSILDRYYQRTLKTQRNSKNMAVSSNRVVVNKDSRHRPDPPTHPPTKRGTKSTASQPPPYPDIEYISTQDLSQCPYSDGIVKGPFPHGFVYTKLKTELPVYYEFRGSYFSPKTADERHPFDVQFHPEMIHIQNLHKINVADLLHPSLPHFTAKDCRKHFLEGNTGTFCHVLINAERRDERLLSRPLPIATPQTIRHISYYDKHSQPRNPFGDFAKPPPNACPYRFGELRNHKLYGRIIVCGRAPFEQVGNLWDGWDVVGNLPTICEGKDGVIVPNAHCTNCYNYGHFTNRCYPSNIGAVAFARQMNARFVVVPLLPMWHRHLLSQAGMKFDPIRHRPMSRSYPQWNRYWELNHYLTYQKSNAVHPSRIIQTIPRDLNGADEYRKNFYLSQNITTCIKELGELLIDPSTNTTAQPMATGYYFTKAPRDASWASQNDVFLRFRFSNIPLKHLPREGHGYIATFNQHLSNLIKTLTRKTETTQYQGGDQVYSLFLWHFLQENMIHIDAWNTTPKNTKKQKRKPKTWEKTEKYKQVTVWVNVRTAIPSIFRILSRQFHTAKPYCLPEEWYRATNKTVMDKIVLTIQQEAEFYSDHKRGYDLFRQAFSAQAVCLLDVCGNRSAPYDCIVFPIGEPFLMTHIKNSIQEMFCMTSNQITVERRQYVGRGTHCVSPIQHIAMSKTTHMLPFQDSIKNTH